MGLRASIYRNAQLGDCSNDGISGMVDEVTIVNADGPYTPTREAPAVMLVPGNIRGTVKMVRARHTDAGFVEDKPEGKLGPMMGGTYVGTPDSRLAEAIAKLGSNAEMVPFHDRWETPAEYARYSA